MNFSIIKFFLIIICILIIASLYGCNNSIQTTKSEINTSNAINTIVERSNSTEINVTKSKFEGLSRHKKIKIWKKLESQMNNAKSRADRDKIQDDWQTLLHEVYGVTKEDVSESEKSSSEEVARLFPTGILEPLTDQFPPSTLCFCELSEYFSPLLEYDGKSLAFEELLNSGFITDIGNIPIENVNEQSPEVIALAKYESPDDPRKKEKEFFSDGITFPKKVAVTVGNTYILRVIMYPTAGKIYALKVHRKDTDGSIIVFVKTIKTFERPPLNQELVEKVTKALQEKGYTDVKVGINDYELTLNGTIPKGEKREFEGIIIKTSVLSFGNISNETKEK